MSDFKIHHHVNELIHLLGSRDKSSAGSISADSHTEELLKNRTPNVTTKVSALTSLQKLSENAPNPEQVRQCYEDLKAKNVREVDPLTYLLAQISGDEKCKNFLKKHADDSKRRSAFLAAAQEGSLKKLTEAAASNQSTSKESLHKERNYSKDVSNVTKSGTNVSKNATSISSCLPSWISERATLSWDFVEFPEDNNATVGPLGVLPVNTQEYKLITDLLYIMVGIEGDYILVKPILSLHEPRSFVIDETCDTSLRELLKRILPLCSNYSITVRFVEEKSSYDCGFVNQALSAAMWHLLKDYFVLVAQLENQHLKNLLSLQKLWFHLQPTIRTMEILASVATTINKGECRGGNVLTVLHEKAASLTGDSKAQELCLFLLQQSCVPYFKILEEWIYKGRISDPYNEFLILDNELLRNEETPVDIYTSHWEKHYTIRREQIPIFLERVTGIILRSGKYLNVIRGCGHNVKNPEADCIVYTSTERKYEEQIEKAYSFASKTLLDLLLEEYHLMNHLRSVKHFFLIDQGDFLVQFMDMAEEELSKPIGEVMPTRLHSLLELALRTSILNSDKNQDCLGVDLRSNDIVTEMSKIINQGSADEVFDNMPEYSILGFEGLSFTYSVKWPVLLLLNKETLTCYQMLFRQLFYCKYVERILGSIWTINKLAKPQPLGSYTELVSAFALRHQMLHFVQNLEYYMMVEVIEPNWTIFQENMLKVKNVDDVIKFHQDFAQSCIADCMMTSIDLLTTVNGLLKLCFDFANFIKHHNRPDPYYGHKQDKTQTGFSEQVSGCAAEFRALFLQLLELITDYGDGNYSDKMVNILYRLNFNEFYSSGMQNSSSTS